MENGFRINRDNLACIHDQYDPGTYWQPPDWRCLYFEQEDNKNYSDEIATKVDLYIESKDNKCCNKCPGYAPETVQLCKIHDIEYTDWCSLCHPDRGQHMSQSEINELTSWANGQNMIGGNFLSNEGGTVMGLHWRVINGKVQYAITNWWYHIPKTILVFNGSEVLYKE